MRVDAGFGFVWLAPVFMFLKGAAGVALLDVGRNGEGSDGEADQLPLTAAETADGVAHHDQVFEVVGAQPGATKGLCGTVLALDG